MTTWAIRFIMCFLFIEISARTVTNVYDAYQKERNSLIREELTQTLGGRLELNEDEEKLNIMLKRYKKKYYNDLFDSGNGFNMSKNYLTYGQEIESSEMFQIIRRMPKGAVLHLHSTLSMDADYLLGLTYEDHLYACYQETDDNLQLQFSDTFPHRPCASGNWTLLSELRTTSINVQEFDNKLKKHFTLTSAENIDTDINTVWNNFHKVYLATKELITYRPVREKFVYDVLKRHYEDNVLYIEMRSGLHVLYELDGRTHDKTFMVDLHHQVTEKFKEKHPDFIGIKLILTTHRAKSMEKIEEALNLTRRLKQEMPEMIAGFDLVGQEDLGKPLKEFLPLLLEYKEDLNYYFHGGETNWFGTASDENLYDAILLGSKRIGHAYALLKHPILMSLVRENDIALEVNLISNMVLSLVRDVRNHPLSTYMALDLPVVLSSDDPGVWNATPLSHDFYVAFLGASGVHSDLRMLKQLALNSIKYSAADEHAKRRLFTVFQKRWNQFVEKIISQDYSELLAGGLVRYTYL